MKMRLVNRSRQDTRITERCQRMTQDDT